MKTLYCLGGAPQFRLPCLKYGFLIKEKDNKYKNITPKNNTISKDFYNVEEIEKETIVDQWIDQIYPLRSIKRCVQINPTMKLNMRKFYRHLRQSLSIGINKSATKIKKEEKEDNNLNKDIESNKAPDNIHEGKKLKNLKFIFDRNKNNYKDSLYNISDYNNKYNKTNNYFRKEENSKIQIQTQIDSNISLSKPKNTKVKLFNYNYPISNESGSLDLCQSLISKQKTKLSTTQFLSLSNNNNNSLSNNSNSRIIFNSKYLNNIENNKITIEISKSDINRNTNTNIKTVNKLNNINSLVNINKTDKKKKTHFKLKKFNYISSIENVINKRKRLRKLAQINKLNILYSENEEQFYRKYDKHVKNKFLNGLCLTHINSSPKVILNDLEQKIKNIKSKVGVVKSIVDKTFPRVLADISSIKKEFEKGQGKQGFNSPYIERLNKIKKQQKKLNLLFSDPFKIISRNKNDIKNNI